MKENRRGVLIGIVLFAFLLNLSSCGYGLSGRGLVVPETARTIAILPFLNETNEPAVDTDVTGAVVREFIADGRLRVVDREDADLVLRGAVVSFEVVPLSYTIDAYVQQYRVRLMAKANLTDRNGKTIWEERTIESNLISSYPVTLGNISASKVAKGQALQKASQDLAMTIRSHILEGF